MSLADLIDEYESASKSLSQAITQDDLSMVEFFDQKISNVFDQILEDAADNSEDNRLLAEFLVRQLLATCEETRTMQRVCARLLSLASPGEIADHKVVELLTKPVVGSRSSANH